MASQVIPPVVSEYFATIHRMDPDAWVACFTEQATSYEPGAPAPLHGHAALRQFLVRVLAAFQTIRLMEDHVFLYGNRVAVKFTGRGTGTNGREVTFEGIDVFEISQDGKIQAMWGYWDPAAMMAQLQG
ncbi:MAG: putative Steroid delta-isomerase [Nitrospira sp.]|jgi:steroid delta-isomerase|nr:putative Steroid delta-isomerase [Nitrospira sp.]